jgi:hypothetical protein
MSLEFSLFMKLNYFFYFRYFNSFIINLDLQLKFSDDKNAIKIFLNQEKNRNKNKTKTKTKTESDIMYSNDSENISAS